MRVLTGALAAILATAGCGGASPATSSSVATGSAACGPAAQLGASLKMPQSVEVYVTPGNPSVDAATARVVRVLDSYMAAANGKLTYRVIPLRPDVDAAKAKALGLMLIPASGSSEGGAPAYYLGLVFRQGSEKVVLPSLPVDAEKWVDFWVSARMREVRDLAEHSPRTFGVLVGHGELSPGAPNLLPAGDGTPTLEQIITQSFRSYRFVDVDLKGGAVPLDDSLAGLLVTQPTSDLTDAELRAIDRFVMKGKPLAVIASSANVRAGDPKMRVTLGAHGLERLLAGYGIELRRDLVLDPAGAVIVSTVTPESARYARIPQLVQVAPAASAPLFARVAALTVPFPSSLVVHHERQPRATFSVIAHTSAQGRSEAKDGTEVSLASSVGAAPVAGEQLALAALVEGPLLAAFAPATGSGTASGRVLVIASSELLANPFAVALARPADLSPADIGLLEHASQDYARESLTPAVLTFKNMLDWMTDETGAVRCPP